MSETTQVASPIDYTALMAKAAAEAAQQEKPDNKFISFKSGMLSFNGNVAPGNKIQCVIISSAFENSYFPNDYDPNKVVSPDCWAVSHVEADMAPNNEATNPVSPACEDCPKNQWEEDPKTKKNFKQCKNVRRLALVLASTLEGDPLTAEVMYAKLPVTSVGNWAKYVNQISNVVKRPPWGVITEMSVVPDIKSQFKVNFQFVGLVPDDKLEGCHALQEIAYKDILFDYPKNKPEVEAPAPAPKAGKAKY